MKIFGFGKCFVCGKLGSIQAYKDDNGKIIEETKKCCHGCR